MHLSRCTLFIYKNLTVMLSVSSPKKWLLTVSGSNNLSRARYRQPAKREKEDSVPISFCLIINPSICQVFSTFISTKALRCNSFFNYFAKNLTCFSSLKTLVLTRLKQSYFYIRLQLNQYETEVNECITSLLCNHRCIIR